VIVLDLALPDLPGTRLLEFTRDDRACARSQ